MQHITKRRTLTWMVVGLSSAPAAVFAAIPNMAPSSPIGAQPAPDVARPYDTIPTPILSDRQIVRFFFSYECPHCRNYHNGLVQWGTTLPAPIRFEATPLITAPDNNNLITAVFGRLIGQSLDPKALAYYDHLMYEKMLGDAVSGIMPATNLKIEDALAALVDAGIPAGRIKAAIQDADTMKKIEAQIPWHAKVIKTYGIVSTPVVAIAGKSLVTPDHANSNATQFLQLLNGMISRAIEGMRHGG